MQGLERLFPSAALFRSLLLVLCLFFDAHDNVGDGDDFDHGGDNGYLGKMIKQSFCRGKLAVNWCGVGDCHHECENNNNIHKCSLQLQEL